MIRAVFSRNGAVFRGFTVSGHAGFAKAGEDIVCAGVSSAVMLIVNMAESAFGLPCEIEVGENKVLFQLAGKTEMGSRIIGALYAHLKTMESDYPDFLQVKTSEVFVDD